MQLGGGGQSFSDRAMRRALPSLARCWLACACACAWAAGALLPLDAERLHASVGGFAVMNCHLDFPFGNEIPYHLQWDKDGEVIFSWYSGEGGTGRAADRWGGRVRLVADARALGLGRGSLNLSAVRETDAGLYRCRVTFPNRSPPARNNGTFYLLDVAGGTLIAAPPVNVTVREGERAELECRPKEPGSQVAWQRDGAPLPAAANGSLVLTSATSTDPGEYQCRVQDAEGREQSASAFLDVQYAAKVVYAPKERNLPLGKPASLDCHFSANPPLTNLRWEKDGFLFDPYNVPGVFYSRNGSLLFNRVDESHEGQYSCTPYNALGTAGPSPRVRVRVLRPPALQARPLPLYVARLGASLTLPCALQPTSAQEGDGAAPHWTRKDGGSLPAGRHSVDAGSLTIVDVTAADRGVYTCSATNDAATVSADTELLVENAPPRAPRRLHAVPAARSLHLTWEPGDSGLEVEYTVWYRERAASEWRTMKILSRGVTEATLGNLRPAAEYELRVLSQDAIGDGLFSKPIFVRTHDAAGGAAPDEAPAVTEPAEETQGAVPAPPALLPAAEAAEAETEEPGAPDELEVSARLLDDGALVRWQRARGDLAPCVVHWYLGDRLLDVQRTERDYMLVSAVEEGCTYSARVECARGAGGAVLAVPDSGRLRAAAGAVAGAAALLALLAAVLYAARRRLPALPGKRSR